MKTINTLLRATFFFVLFRFIIWGVQFENRQLADTINYHHSSDLFWIILPIITSLLIVSRNKSLFLKQLGYVLLPCLIIGTIVGVLKNKDYWGYYFKRPTVFNEIKEANRIITLSFIGKSNENSFEIYFPDSTFTSELYGREDPYYGSYDRALMTFSDNSSKPNSSNLFQWFEITLDSTRKISNQRLNEISKIIFESKNIEKPEKEYLVFENNFSGRLIEFETNEGESFEYIYLHSGEVANDHYANYEFLILKTEKDKIFKHQKYFTDFAGFEGIEYVNIAPLLEMIILIFSGLIVLFSRLIFFLYKKQTNSEY